MNLGASPQLPSSLRTWLHTLQVSYALWMTEIAAANDFVKAITYRNLKLFLTHV